MLLLRVVWFLLIIVILMFSVLLWVCMMEIVCGW